jgi:hypothetical protein
MAADEADRRALDTIRQNPTSLAAAALSRPTGHPSAPTQAPTQEAGTRIHIVASGTDLNQSKAIPVGRRTPGDLHIARPRPRGRDAIVKGGKPL